MNESDESNDAGLPQRLRTVTPPSGTHPDAQMDAIGWLIFLGLLILLLPVLPFLLVIWLFSKASDALSQN